MHLDRGILRTHRRSDRVSAIPDDHNTFTQQSGNTNDAPRDPLLCPNIWNAARITDTLNLGLGLVLDIGIGIGIGLGLG